MPAGRRHPAFERLVDAGVDLAHPTFAEAVDERDASDRGP
jgi:hypothetical protein